MIRPSKRFGFWGLLGALGFAAALISLAGYFGSCTWWLEILSHFRVQYTLCFLALAAIFALGQKWRAVAGALALALLNSGPVLIFLWPFTTAPSGDAPLFRAMLMNVNCQGGDPTAVRAAISNSRPDLLVLEEIDDRWLASLAPVLDSYPYRAVEPRFDNFGIGLFSRHPLDTARIVPFGPINAPSIFAEMQLADRKLTLVATHPMPPGDAWLAAERNRQLDWIARRITELSGPVLLLGDLNMSPWSPAYRRFLNDSGLKDSARGRSIRPTWPASIPLLWIPLDHALHTSDFAIHERTIGPDIGSDHLPLTVDFTWSANLP